MAVKRMLDLFCGRLGWSKAFLAAGWECVGVDLIDPPEIPPHFEFYRGDILQEIILLKILTDNADFICVSSPCEQFSVHGMKMFHANPPYPELGIQLFNHTRAICEASGVPYIMENVRSAQDFVGRAIHHCGPFYLWGNAVPPLVPQGIKKGIDIGNGKDARKARAQGKLTEYRVPYSEWMNRDKAKAAAKVATIPPELAKCVVDYAEYLTQ